MELLKQIVVEIAATPDRRLSELPFLHRCLLPLLGSAAALYGLCLSLRRHLYRLNIIRSHSLPVPVVSVGNLTWGGTGKTPMVEFLARFFDDAGVPPLILTRGYAGGDEAKMLERHLLGTSARIGLGSNRRKVADCMLKEYAYMKFRRSLLVNNLSTHSFEARLGRKVGVAILDDGMQHWRLSRDVEIVMLNALMLWGNSHIVPRGPLREPVDAIGRADIVMIHHADLVSDEQLQIIKLKILTLNSNLLIFYSRLAASHLFNIKNPESSLPLKVVINRVVLCISAIGCPDAFIRSVDKIGTVHVDRLDFSDHHFLLTEDIDAIRKRLYRLDQSFSTKAIVVMTEKDYDRDPLILKELEDVEVLVLCSSFQILSINSTSKEIFEAMLKELLVSRFRGE